MARRCPVCGQILPEAIDERILHARLEKLTASAVARQEQALRRDLEEQYAEVVRQREEQARRQALQGAQAAHRQEVAALRAQAENARRESAALEKRYEKDLADAERRAQLEAASRMKDHLAKLEEERDAARRDAQEAQRRRDREVERVRRDAEKEVERARTTAARLAARESQARFGSLEAKAAKERARHEADMARCRRQIDDMSRQLEHQTSERLGEEAEFDLWSALKREFPEDRIERVQRGVKGADIIHYIMAGPEEVGRIVYECKNVSAWQNAFVIRAKQYQAQYSTPYVLIVTGAFPRKQRGLCVVRGIPIIQPPLAIALAGIIRQAAAAIGQMRATSRGRDIKAQKLFDYIVGDEFQTRFGQVADAVAALKEQQGKEKEWHENAWEKEAKLFEQIDARRREVAARVKAITGEDLRRQHLRLVNRRA